jgi:hypothetical protein
MNANKTVTATFTPITSGQQFALTILTTGSGNVILSPPGGVYNSGTVVTLTASPNAGQQFDGWSGNVTGTANPTTITMNANKTVTAAFSQIPSNLFTLTVNTSGSGSITLNPLPISGSPTGGSYAAGTVVTLTAFADFGHQFNGWSGDLSGLNNPQTLTINSAKTVTATFTQLPFSIYSLNVTVTGSGSVTLSPSGGVYFEGTVVTVTATPAPNQQFNGWGGDLSGVSNPQTITMNSNKNITAAFGPVSGGGGGSVVFEEVKTGVSSLSNSVSTSENITGANGNLYLAAIASKDRENVQSVSGLGLNWIKIKAQCSGRDQTGVEIWMASGNPGGNDVVAATFNAVADNAIIAVARYSNTDAANPVGTLISGNTVGADGLCSGGIDTDAYNFNMAVSASGAMIFGAIATRNRNNQPGSGYMELIDMSQGAGGLVAGLAVQERTLASPGTIAFSGTLNKPVDWAIIALEIRPASALKFSGSPPDSGMVAARKPDLAASRNVAPLTIAGAQPAVNQTGSLPEKMRLGANYPDPFNSQTGIEYTLPTDANVRLEIFNILGQKVRTLVNERQSTGFKKAIWQGKDDHGLEVGSGVYFIRLSAGGQILTGKMTLLK